MSTEDTSTERWLSRTRLFAKSAAVAVALVCALDVGSPLITLLVGVVDGGAVIAWVGASWKVATAAWYLTGLLFLLWV